MNAATYFTTYRFFVFVFSIICSIVMGSVAAWNLTIAMDIDALPAIHVDAVLIAIGVASLLFVLSMLVIDFLRKETVTRQVWFECLWVGLFALLSLAAAGAVTTTLSSMECVTFDKAGVITLGPCVSVDLTIAFAWAGAINLILYMCILVVITILHQRLDPLIWKTNTRDCSWFSVKSALGSEPSSPKQAAPKSLNVRRPMQTEFSKRLVARRERDLEKQGPMESVPTPASTVPATLQVPPKTAPILRPSLDRLRPSLDHARPSLDHPRPSIDRARPSLDHARPSMDNPVPERPPWTPRKLQLSAVPASSVQAATSDVPPSLGAAVPSTSLPSVSQSKSIRKPRILRLHRPPSLDLSQIINNR
ncbi:uncharacterized protein FIBRA_00437 [Fibroporia radiculosa]|uniref:MARVEL domain-containing protein n=1 Tax=Fibroporia radiculosa TaxID=599839 RepID=J4GHS1_9APHY|nr:uncharacterized protein FIBRA_00437 [Fibroporia radiculosa]CCL98440.1 predicted protein [Fibroporia radiculosa]